MTKPQKTLTMRACRRFVSKLTKVFSWGDESATCLALRLPKNRITRWKEGNRIYLDEAFLVAQRFGLSLDYLANDEIDYPEQLQLSEAAELAAKLVTGAGWTTNQVIAALTIKPVESGAAQQTPGNQFRPASAEPPKPSKRKPRR